MSEHWDPEQNFDKDPYSYPSENTIITCRHNIKFHNE